MCLFWIWRHQFLPVSRKPSLMAMQWQAAFPGVTFSSPEIVPAMHSNKYSRPVVINRSCKHGLTEGSQCIFWPLQEGWGQLVGERGKREEMRRRSRRWKSGKERRRISRGEEEEEGEGVRGRVGRRERRRGGEERRRETGRERGGEEVRGGVQEEERKWEEEDEEEDRRTVRRWGREERGEERGSLSEGHVEEGVGEKWNGWQTGRGEQDDD